jgi:hypothetical protein
MTDIVALLRASAAKYNKNGNASASALSQSGGVFHSDPRMENNLATPKGAESLEFFHVSQIYHVERGPHDAHDSDGISNTDLTAGRRDAAAPRARANPMLEAGKWRIWKIPQFPAGLTFPFRNPKMEKMEKVRLSQRSNHYQLFLNRCCCRTGAGSGASVPTPSRIAAATMFGI